MRDDDLIEGMREAVRKLQEKSPEELWDELVRRGAIDSEGNVLLRMPQPPKKKGRKKPNKPSDHNGEQG